MDAVITKFETKFRKARVTNVQSGDNVRVHQKVQEGAKERTQSFEGMVIRTRRANSLTANITVRRIASGVGVEKTFFMHSPTITKVEVIKRTKVRRNFLSYMRARTGKSTRLSEQEFDRDATNVKEEASAEAKPEPKDKSDAETEKPTKAELKAQAEAEKEKDKAEDKKEDKKSEKTEAKPEKEDKPKENKAAAKKAKAEEFRKSQEAKNK